MIKRHQTRANIGVGLGIVLLIGASLASIEGESRATDGGVLPTSMVVFMFLSIALGLAGAVFYIWGCVNYTQGKGYSGWLGLLGLLSLVGLLILVVMPDRRKHGEPPAAPSSNLPPHRYPPPPGPPPTPSGTSEPS